MKTLPLILLFFLSFTLFGQQFERFPGIDLKSGYNGFASFVDYNSDGHLDVFVTGVDFGQRFSNAMLYTNNGNETFSESNIFNIPRVIYGDLSWADFDNNGTLDLLYAGTTSGFEEFGITKVYRNVGNGCEFIEVPINIPGLSSCTVDWVDINNDGFLDIYYHGINTNNEFDQAIYQNLGGDSFSVIQNSGLNAIAGSDGNATVNNSEWADFDQDGLKDLIVAMSTSTEYKVEVYKNLGNFNFERINTSIPDLNYTQLKVGDFNNDGLSDIVILGSTSATLSSGDSTADLLVFSNNNNFSFSEVFRINDIGVFISDLDLGDFNNDNLLDIACYGTGASFKRLQMFTNQGNNNFIQFNHNILNCHSGGVSFGDIDNDNDLDLLYYGRIENPVDEEVSYIFENILINSQLPQNILTRETCFCNNEVVFSLDESVDSVSWNFGDINSGGDNLSTNDNPVHVFSSSGIYQVTATYIKGGVTNTLTIIIEVNDTFSIDEADNIMICDPDADGSYNFRFDELLNDQILQNLDAQQFDILYYTNEDNADQNLYALTLPYTSTELQETIYYRVQRVANPDCYLIGDFEIVIDVPPVIGKVDDLFQCDDNSDGLVSSFDTSNIESMVLGNQTGTVLSYFDGNMNPLPNPLPNPLSNTIPSMERITVRIAYEGSSSCYNETFFNLIVTEKIRAGNIADIRECEEDSDGIVQTFDTTNIEEQLIDGQQNVIVRYFDNKGNELQSPLPNPFSNTNPYSENILARIESEFNSSCFEETNFRFIVEECETNQQEDIVFPEYFTPNGDGIHDFWNVKGGDRTKVISINIYNRSGRLVATITPYSLGWQGIYNNKSMPSSEYWFSATLKDNTIIKGHFSLIR